MCRAKIATKKSLRVGGEPDALKRYLKRPDIGLETRRKIVARLILKPDDVGVISEECDLSIRSLYKMKRKGVEGMDRALTPKKPGPKQKPRPTPEIDQETQNRLRQLERESKELRKKCESLEEERDRTADRHTRLRRQLAAILPLLPILMALVQGLQGNLVPSRLHIKRVVVILFMTGQMSYRRIRRCLDELFNVDISVGMIDEILKEAGQKAVSVWAGFNIIWSKIGVIDEIFLGRKALFVALVDPRSRVLHHLEYSVEKRAEAVAAFLRGLKENGFDPVVIITDLYKVYWKMVTEIFPGAYHQLCTFHSMKKVNKMLRKAGKRITYLKHRIDTLAASIEKIDGRKKKKLAGLWANLSAARIDLEEAIRAQDELSACKDILYGAYRGSPEKALSRLETARERLEALGTKDANKLLKHFRTFGDGLFAFARGICDVSFERTSNGAEFVNAFLRPYLNRMKRFKSEETGQRFAILFLMYYNLRPFDTGPNKGRCPLEIGGCLSDGKNQRWIDYIYPLSCEPNSEPVTSQNLRISAFA